MKVLLLGGTGVFGKYTAQLLARDEQITEIALASRHLEVAQQAAYELGDKARAICVDIKDEVRLSFIARGYNIIVNAAGPTSEVQVPAIQSAIEAGVHYCDLGVGGRNAERALQLDTQARARGITAIIGTGWMAISSLMAVHASRQLDETEELSVCFQFDYSPGDYYSAENSLAKAHEKGYVETSWFDILDMYRGPVPIFRSGQWERVEPGENPFETVHPSGYRIKAYPVDSQETLTLPHSLPRVKTISTLLSLVPSPLNMLYLEQGQGIAKGKTDHTRAALAIMETVVSDKERWLSTPLGYPSGWLMWAIATGNKDGRQARYMCWPIYDPDWSWTCVSFTVAILRILRGQVAKYGVLPPEACFELTSFMEDSARYVSSENRGKSLLKDHFEWLE
jgi:saccharopine dehydrogenase-like NADP-dependent oxidoreductase